MTKTFPPQRQTQAEALLKHYPHHPEAAMLPMLNLAESEFGLIDDEAELLVAELCRVSQVRVHNAWAFYHMYARQPRGKYHIRVCHNISCSLLGAEHLIDILQEKLGLEGEGTTEDKLFSIERVECLGSCGTAPALLVNEDLYENMTEEKIKNLLEELRLKA
ncbi:MAG: NAD(P)H-dependent oxidoreductase subunit E [candidate division Zixibacteria bacterium]|nr:NAD(P)H-dependent oxidoreductase subunit E [Candidatus Tariuqbacter arcticus]